MGPESLQAPNFCWSATASGFCSIASCFRVATPGAVAAKVWFKLKRNRAIAPQPGNVQMKGLSISNLPSFGWRVVVAMVIFPLAMFFFCPRAFSQNVRQGELSARTWCASCHNVESNGSNFPNDTIPSFVTISMRPDTSKTSLENFLRSSHPQMPIYGLRKDEIPDIVAYIVSLKPKASGLTQRRTRP
jgi:cytochrome c553